MLVVIPCGGAKLKARVLAEDMYIGGYHRACQAYARSLIGSGGDILILSALYGFLALHDEIAPYDLRMGQPGSVAFSVLVEQIKERGLFNPNRVVLLGGQGYVRPCLRIWPHAETPLDGVGGIGKQLAWLKKNTIRFRRQLKKLEG